jgi:hypothetical protein
MEMEMFKRLLNYTRNLTDRQRINIALSKGGAMMNAREINLKNPATWEFSGFSQNGEDGILDVLRSKLLNSNRYFIEIGAADGIENNSAWLVVAERYSGMMIEGDPWLVERANKMVIGYSIGAECLNMFITKEKVKELKELSFYKDPDVFSLDIDGNDYYIAQALFDNGFRPKIFVVEYNAVYGPERSATIEYSDDFSYRTAHSTELYYGVSIMGWRNFFESHGYRFITVDQNGVNAFFVDPQLFNSEFLDAILPLEFAENLYQHRKFRATYDKQFSLIKDQKFIEI